MLKKIQITLTKRDYISLFILLMNKKLILLASAPLIIAIPAGAVLLGYVGTQGGLPLASLMLPYSLVVLLMALIFLRALVSPALRQFKAAQKEFGNAFEFALDSEGFVINGGANSARYAYARLERALETRGYFFFFVNGGQACIFPKRLLNAQDSEFLSKILPKCATISPGELGGVMDDGDVVENGGSAQKGSIVPNDNIAKNGENRGVEL